MKTAKNHIIGLILIAGVLFAAFGHCQEESVGGDTYSIYGTVKEADWVGSSLVVSYYDTSQNVYVDLTIDVTEKTKILRGTEKIAFNDIEQNDEVKVEYYKDAFGELKAKSIVDMNLGND